MAENEFDLYMRVDSNTAGHRQWFYFSMKNERRVRIRLHVYRFRKVYSLYQRGMKPYVRSRRGGNEWKPGGENVAYHLEDNPNDFVSRKDRRTYVLSFSYTFEHDNDEVFIAAGIPYTYSFLQRQLNLYQSAVASRDNLSF